MSLAVQSRLCNSNAGAWVWSLVGELRSHTSHGKNKNKQTKTRDVLESAKSKTKVPADSVSAETLPPDSPRASFWLCPHMAVRERSEISWHLITFVGLHLHDLITSHWALGFNLWIWKKSESERRSVISDSLQPHKLYSLSLLQGIFPIYGSNPGLLNCREIFFYQLTHQGSPDMKLGGTQHSVYSREYDCVPIFPNKTWLRG